MWRSVEMWKSIFSFLGLILVIVDYEVNQYYNGDRGLSKIEPDDKWTGSPSQLEAIKIRLKGPTNIIRTLNIICSILAVLMLFIRNKLKMDWTNNDFRTELYLETKKMVPDKFIQIYDVTKGDQDQEAYEGGGGEAEDKYQHRCDRPKVVTRHELEDQQAVL